MTEYQTVQRYASRFIDRDFFEGCPLLEMMEHIVTLGEELEAEGFDVDQMTFDFEFKGDEYDSWVAGISINAVRDEQVPLVVLSEPEVLEFRPSGIYNQQQQMKVNRARILEEQEVEKMNVVRIAPEADEYIEYYNLASDLAEAFPDQDAHDFVYACRYNDWGPLQEHGLVNLCMLKQGYNDGPNWLWLVTLANGETWMAEGGCDYTGWDCQSYINWDKTLL